MHQTYVIPISVKGIVIEDDGVWLRKNERNEWELPGGKLDDGEQPIEAVKREMQEELGFNVQAQDLVQAHVCKIEGSLDESNGVLVVSYLCKILEKTGEFEHDGEGGAAQFQKFLLSEVGDLNMPNFYKKAIAGAAWMKKLIELQGGVSYQSH